MYSSFICQYNKVLHDAEQTCNERAHLQRLKSLEKGDATVGCCLGEVAPEDQMDLGLEREAGDRK